MVVLYQNTNRTSRRTKNILKTAFIEILFYKPYDKITVTDIVNYADFNRCTFYNYYADKEELVIEIVEEIKENLIENINFVQEENSYQISDYNSIFAYIYAKQNFFKLWQQNEPIPGITEYFIESLRKSFINYAESNFLSYTNTSVTMFSYGITGVILEWIKKDFNPLPEIMTNECLAVLNNFGIRSKNNEEKEI